MLDPSTTIGGDTAAASSLGVGLRLGMTRPVNHVVGRTLRTVAGPSRPTSEVTELLQQLIRNRCVNDGTPESGGEIASVDVLTTYLERPGIDLERYEPQPTRASLAAPLQRTNPDPPTPML